ncbi:hypothetical protein [Kitasatospora kifunensis]|uniref:Uncharacterized protein n=1 Tax=Kitasatospora kifunensis TaxID=58351 RepID=A0A7W7R1R9_KITKI|nr:hypothetical protein [Kitasatospora kifunensis]MBB4923827.1 hypothetical protein [Kitasatospora kifunensis]
MSRPATTPTTIYQPQLGELVNDLAHQGARGVYMGVLGDRAYLRPPGGGVEWDTDPDRLEPALPVSQLEPVSQRSTPRRADRVELSGEPDR